MDYLHYLIDTISQESLAEQIIRCARAFRGIPSLGGLSGNRGVNCHFDMQFLDFYGHKFTFSYWTVK
jgi:hypothetical protein